VAVTPDGRRAVSASWGHTLRLWDLESGETIRTLKVHEGVWSWR
jgi:WD40 repeat protein